MIVILQILTGCILRVRCVLGIGDKAVEKSDKLPLSLYSVGERKSVKK